jgi:hypothetical protein
MLPPASPEPLGSGSSLSERAFKAAKGAAASLQPTKPPSGDLLDTLRKEEEKVLRKHWPDGKPTGSGDSYFDQMMKIRVSRLWWRSRVETGGEIVWLVGKLGSVLICVGVASEYLLR